MLRNTEVTRRRPTLHIVPDELWTHKGFHLVVDAKSVNHQVHSTLATLGKVIPTRHHRNERYFYVEPMNLGEVVNRFIDADQLTEQVMVIAENVDRETWERAMSNTKGLMEELLENTESKEKWTAEPTSGGPSDDSPRKETG